MAGRRALVSVSDKAGLVDFCRGLVAIGFELVSTGGTRQFLTENGLSVIDIGTYTGFPEIMGGRVKTLHPKVHGGILGRPDLKEDAVAMQAHGIVPFELVICNLYPFEATVARPDVTVAEAIEKIDVGGPTMVRAAAKNCAHVAIVTAASQYDSVLSALQAGPLPLELRQSLALAAFRMTARYDAAIVQHFSGIFDTPSAAIDADDLFPAQLTITAVKQAVVRHGENPHQQAAFYADADADDGSLARAEQLNGKELSYNNLIDLDAARAIAREFDQPAVAILKHTNPCGCATADDLASAFDRALAGDPVSAFGSIIGVNRPVDAATATRMTEPGQFIEAIIAPDFLPEALEILTSRPKWKKNVRLMRCPGMLQSGRPLREVRRVSGGLLLQLRDEFPDVEEDWKVVTRRAPTPQEWQDLKFAWRVCKHVKSNAIVFARQQMVVGVGAGQMSRLDSSEIAARKAGDRAVGGVVASDAFFPFRDGIDQAAKAGIRAAIQPGGSVNDEQVIAACDEHEIAMVFTGRRHFKH